jgi:hypothetical protein
MNNLYTLSYFRKRLLSGNLTSKILVNDYEETDRRYWTISIGSEKIFCTCFREGTSNRFEFWDGGNLLQGRRSISTKSMNVVIDFIQGLRTQNEE